MEITIFVPNTPTPTPSSTEILNPNTETSCIGYVVGVCVDSGVERGLLTSSETVRTKYLSDSEAQPFWNFRYNTNSWKTLSSK